VFSQFSDHSLVRRELFRITAAMKNSGVTTVLTAERTEEYGDITRFGVEEFVVDNVIILFFATRAFMRNR
jgi:circadian clock protein KaiC